MYPSACHPTYGIFVEKFASSIERQGADVTCKAVIRGKGSSFIEKILKYFVVTYDIACCLFREQYDIVYVHYLGHTLIPFVFLRKFVKVPLILNAHGGDVLPITFFGMIIEKMVRPVVKGADLIVVPSEFLKKIICGKYKIRCNDVFVSASSGVDLGVFRPIKKNSYDNKFVIGYVSRLDQGKGWDIFVESLLMLKNKRIDNFHAIIVGHGSQAEVCAGKIKEYDLSGKVDLIGLVPNECLVNYFNMMDVFVFPTKLDESLGLVAIEAMACGLPVIASNKGALKEYIFNGLNGFLYDDDDPVRLTELLIFFINMQPGVIERYSKKSLKIALEYDAEIISENMYRKLLGIL